MHLEAEAIRILYTRFHFDMVISVKNIKYIQNIKLDNFGGQCIIHITIMLIIQNQRHYR